MPVEPTADQSGAWWIVVDDHKCDPPRRSFYSSHATKSDAEELCATAQARATQIENEHVADLVKLGRPTDHLVGKPCRLQYSVIPNPHTPGGA